MRKTRPKNLLDTSHQGCNLDPRKRGNSGLKSGGPHQSVIGPLVCMLRNRDLLSCHLHVLVFTQLDLPSLLAPFLHLDQVLLFHLRRGTHLCCFSLNLVMGMATTASSESPLQLINTSYQHLLPSYQYKDSSVPTGFPAGHLSFFDTPCNHSITYICPCIHSYIYYMVFDVLSESLYYKLRSAWELKSPGGPRQRRVPTLSSIRAINFQGWSQGKDAWEFQL